VVLQAALCKLTVQQFQYRVLFPELNNVQCSIILLDSENILKRDTKYVAEDDPVDPSMGGDCYMFSPVGFRISSIAL